MADGGHHLIESRGGSIVSLASTVYNILHDEDYIRGTNSHSSCIAIESGLLILEH